MTTLASFKKTDLLQNIRLRDNLISLMKQHNTNMTNIYKHTGVPITTIQRICKDPNANPTLASLIPIAEYFSITLAQLIGEEALPSNTNPNTSPQHWTSIPVISWQQATNWPEIKLNNHQQRFINTEMRTGNNAFALEILDDHHENFHTGSILIIEDNMAPNNRDYVITHKNNSNHVSLKQILLHEGDTYLKPTNPEFKTTLMTDSYKILGVVIQVRMNLK